MMGYSVRNLLKIWGATLAMFLLLGVCPAYPQDNIFEEAVQRFQNKEYGQASALFTELLKQYRKEPTYHYYLGRCYLEGSRDYQKAITTLTYAAAKGTFTDTYFYLGLAYLHAYRFEEAADVFDKYALFATWGDLRDKPADIYKIYATNGMEASKSGVKAILLNKTEIQENNLTAYLNKHLNEGTVVQVPKDYKTFFPGQQGGNLLAFKTGDAMYYPNFNLRGRSLDIFMKSDNAPQPEVVDAASTGAGNEKFAWYDVPNQTLYFSSDGFNSMGGYDIFRTEYNPQTKSWSAPENLGLPINSTYNETHFVYNHASGKAVVISDREPENKTFTAYQVQTELQKTDRSNMAPNQLLSMSRFENPHKPNVISLTNKPNTKSKAYNPANNIQPDLLKALTLQLKADSFLRASESKRSKLHETTSANAKTQLRKSIAADEAQWKATQQKADDLFESLNNTSQQTEQKAPPEPKKYASMSASTFSNKPQNKVVNDFKVLENNAYTNTDEIEINPSLPAGLLYKIQLGVFSQAIEPERFGGLTPISAETIDGKNLTKYYCGKFSNYHLAYDALKKIKLNGFSDAYIISFYDGKKISVSRAKELEKTL